jgi:TRAP-type C4-dicarboxylate transport system substrate-binding protein
MRKFTVCVTTVFILLFLLVIICPVAHAQQKVVKINYSTFWATTHRFFQLDEEWCKEIEKRTNGTVKITPFAGGTLTPFPQTYDSVVKGIADMGESVLAYTKGRFPLMEVTDLPIGHKSGYASTKLMNELFAKYKPKEFNDVKVMYFHTHPPAVLHSKRPVNNLEDVKGMKIRSTGVSAKIVKELGGTPVAMPISEVYDALSKGIIDGNLQTWEAMHGHRLGEILHYTTECNKAAISTGFFIVMNKNKWNSLTPEQQKIIEQVNQEFIEKQGKLWDEQEKMAKDWTINVLKKGHKVIVLPPEEQNRWAEKVKVSLDEYVADANKLGLPGEEVLKFSIGYLARN